jgi:hypothetical protein
LFNAADDHVAFNFTSHLYGDDRDTNLYSPAIYVTVSPLPAPTAQVESIGEIRFLTLQFQRLSGVTNLTYTVLAASNLTQSSWSFVAGGTNGASMTGPGLIGEIDSPTSGLKNVTVRDLVPVSSTSSRFLKLRITK